MKELDDLTGRFVQPEGTQPWQRQIEMLEAALQEIIDIAGKNSLRCSVCNVVLDIALLTLADVAEAREADGQARG